MDCQVCRNYQPVESEPKPWAPQVGEKVRWDGVSVCVECGVTDKADAGTYVLELVPEGWRAHYKIKDTTYWTTIDHLRPASEAQEHYDGEPCGLVVCEPYKSAADGLRFVYAGRKDRPKYGEWFKNCMGYIERAESILVNPRWILRAVPVEAKPEWKVGDILMSDSRLVMITGIDGERNGRPTYKWDEFGVPNSHGHNFSEDYLRATTAADWTREIGGVKVRAYESDNGIHMYEDVPGEGFDVHHFPNKALAREFCAAKNLPIMPYSLHQGKMDPPA